MDNNAVNDEVTKFNKENLRKTPTTDRSRLPSQNEIDEEKKMMKEPCRMGDNPIKDEVTTFNVKRLRKTSTQEKNTLPTQRDIDDEKKMKE
ncbi:thymosin beta 1 [Phycodurus eques]|uniref:thymosin beta 1 n=1 Tax=Phycodurus eques TaxID=693459 RepID=UPI002ACE7DF9|nr:thymosin beta 1 [Phycodurus eques]